MFRILDIFRRRRRFQPDSPEKALFQKKYKHFQKLLDGNNQALELITDLEEVCYGPKPFKLEYIIGKAERLLRHVYEIAEELDALSGGKYPSLPGAVERIGRDVFSELIHKRTIEKTSFTRPLGSITFLDIAEVGGKAARIGEIANRVGLAVPGGFAVTAYAYHHFMKSNGLYKEAGKILAELDLSDMASLLACSTEIQERIRKSPIPPELEEALLREMDSLTEASGAIRVAVRSSAVGEDSESSFAGQYSSVLGVDRDGLLQAYKNVLASTFNPRAIFYRGTKGYPDTCVVMSVLCIAMVEAEASGVMYTTDPNDSDRGMMLINAVRGLALKAVDGSVPADFYEVDRGGNNLLSARVALKETRLVIGPRGELIDEPVPEDFRRVPCLEEPEIRTLVNCGFVLEAHFGKPQDVEWAMDKDGKIFIVQSRPLNPGLNPERDDPPEELGPTPDEVIPGHGIILLAGATASRGKAFGTAYVLSSEKDMVNVPDGSILIAKQTSTRYVALFGKVRAIVTDVGSLTGHMASVAREFGVPTLVETGNATEVVPHGEEITVDANSRVVYRGRVDSILERKAEVNPMRGSPAYRAAHGALKKITALNLLDPESDIFSPENCHTFHDVIRFAHEMSMREMFNISDDIELSRNSAVHIRVPLPIKILAVDLGGGLVLPRGASEATPDSILSKPFQALLAGMTDPGVRWSGPIDVDQEGPGTPLSESVSRDPIMEDRMVGPSYAVLSEDYLNFNSRLGYHLTVIDTYCGAHVNDNYLLFSFRGGTPDPDRRSRRAMLIAKILERSGFIVSFKGDFVRGEVKKYGCTVLRDKVRMIGRLLGAVRLLDLSLSDAGRVDWYVEQFMKGNYTFSRE